MGIENVAMGYCKIKQYFILFFIALIIGITIWALIKKDQPKKNYLGIFGFSGIVILFLTIMYFFLGSSIGCGISIAGNAYHVAQNFS